MDIMTDDDGEIDGRFWAFMVSLVWPIYSIGAFAWNRRGKKDVTPIVLDMDNVRSGGPTTPSLRSIATTHTASDSIVSRISGKSNGCAEEECEVEGIWLKGSEDHRLKQEPCNNNRVSGAG